MVSKWPILFCDDQINVCPVSDFFESCQPKHQVKVLRFLSLLEDQGPLLPRPYADLLRDGIHELRIKLSGDQYRLLYFFGYRRFIILYEVFLKNTDQVPEKYVNNMLTYRDRFFDMFSPAHLEEIVNENA